MWMLSSFVWSRQNEDGPYIPRPGLETPSDFDKEVMECRNESQRLFNKHGYGYLLVRPNSTVPTWALGWTRRKKNKITTHIARQYGHIISRYYQGVLPYYK